MIISMYACLYCCKGNFPFMRFLEINFLCPLWMRERGALYCIGNKNQNEGYRLPILYHSYWGKGSLSIFYQKMAVQKSVTQILCAESLQRILYLWRGFNKFSRSRRWQDVYTWVCLGRRGLCVCLYMARFNETRQGRAVFVAVLMCQTAQFPVAGKWGQLGPELRSVCNTLWSGIELDFCHSTLSCLQVWVGRRDLEVTMKLISLAAAVLTPSL